MEKWDEINIKSEYMTGLISRAVNKAVKNKIQGDVNVKLNEFTVTDQDEKLHLHLSVDAEISMSELEALLKSKGVI